MKKINDGWLKKGCNCSRSGCGQNYCVCFAQGKKCDPELCACKHCNNIGPNHDHDHNDQETEAKEAAPSSMLALTSFVSTAAGSRPVEADKLEHHSDSHSPEELLLRQEAQSAIIF